jgi:hypothetical protein
MSEYADSIVGRYDLRCIGYPASRIIDEARQDAWEEACKAVCERGGSGYHPMLNAGLLAAVDAIRAMMKGASPVIEFHEYEPKGGGKEKR